MEEGTFAAAPPGLATGPADGAPAHKDRTGAVKVAAGLNLALGGLLLFAAVAAWVSMGVTIDFLRSEGDWDTANEFVAGRIVATSLLAVLGTPYVVAATGVYYRRNWGRVALLVVSGVGLLLVPLGTLVAATTFWALSRPGAEPWFQTPGGSP